MSSATLDSFAATESIRSGAGRAGNGEQTCSAESMGSSPIAASGIDSDCTIPASRIMRERDEHREAWAREYTRANTLEAALERSQQATSDWQGIALHNGEEAARLRVSAARDEGVAKRLIGELADEKYRNGQLIAENVRLLAKYEADTKRLREDLAAYRDSLVTIYDATAGQTGPVVDTIHSTMRELADNDLDDNDPMFDVCQTCGPFDRDYNPMPGCRDCFGGKVVA